MSDLLCTRFESVKNTKPLENVSIISVIEEIKTDKYKELVESIRKDIDPSKSDLKYKLPLFTPTGEFSHRSIAGMETYNGVICLDIDHVEDVIALKKRAIKLNYVYAAFITPSGSGLKVIIKTNATKENYKIVEEEVAKYFSLDAGGIRDNRCKDIARIQFLSWDPDAYINTNSITLNF